MWNILANKKFNAHCHCEQYRGNRTPLPEIASCLAMTSE